LLVEAAKTFFRLAINLDPNFAPAYARLASAIFGGAGSYGTSILSEAFAEGFPIARRALSLDPMDPQAHCTMGWSLWAQGDYEGALAEGRRALAIDPYCALGHHTLGLALLFSGRPKEAIKAIDIAVKLDPHDPLMYLRLLHMSVAHYFFAGL
jgi:tetratricopeptide (TPR) repeat protein